MNIQEEMQIFFAYITIKFVVVFEIFMFFLSIHDNDDYYYWP